jgi:ABC-type transporter Mla maintaining outer membrane lipid asymmetry ATPase subunit MlaF
MSMLALDGVTKRFGSLVALDGCTLTARPGRLTGFLGPNGATATTDLTSHRVLITVLTGIGIALGVTAAILTSDERDSSRAQSRWSDCGPATAAGLSATTKHPVLRRQPSPEAEGRCRQ